MSPKGLYTDSVISGTSTEDIVWKVPKLYVKEIYLLILKHWPEAHIILSKDKGTVDHHFCTLSALLKPTAVFIKSRTLFLMVGAIFVLFLYHALQSTNIS